MSRQFELERTTIVKHLRTWANFVSKMGLYVEENVFFLVRFFFFFKTDEKSQTPQRKNIGPTNRFCPFRKFFCFVFVGPEKLDSLKFGFDFLGVVIDLFCVWV